MVNLIITSIAAATTIATAPAYSPDFGADISCTEDCDSVFTERAGDDPLLVAESAWRSITSPRGSIPGSPDAGWDITSLLRLAATRTEQRAWPGLVRAELAKDDRIETLEVKFAQTASDAWRVTINGTTAEGPFALVGALTPTAAVLEEVLSS